VRREREEVRKEIIHLDGGDKLDVVKIVCWFVGSRSAVDMKLQLAGLRPDTQSRKSSPRRTNAMRFQKGTKNNPLVKWSRGRGCCLEELKAATSSIKHHSFPRSEISRPGQQLIG
jgi:hypothetical protein